MAETFIFQTRARTVDHLGREQIADCPTAISELWKNAYDAYARECVLHIYDGSVPVAAVCDDGHGMSQEDLTNRWLVIGTESKIAGEVNEIDSRFGLPYRRRQGKKGIGRLSVGYLGNLLLLVSKKEGDPFVVMLIDWRIFQNPFLNLQDIQIPIQIALSRDDILGSFPVLFDKLMGNLWGDKDKGQSERTQRLVSAWRAYDALGESELATRQAIEQTLTTMPFTIRHLQQWPVWLGTASHGTAMLVADIIPDLVAQLSPATKSPSEETAIRNLKNSLWSFIDPFEPETENGLTRELFRTSVVGWRGEDRLSIVERLPGFSQDIARTLEHVIEGTVDQDGNFKGRVKAFGRWLDEPIEIRVEFSSSKRSDARVGPFEFFISALEQDASNSTHPADEHARLKSLLDEVAGLMVFRDGFRVMPYGRPDSDFFGVEERRSIHAGREFWNHRRMTGRIALTTVDNPNLRDKAGREGIIDNQASKAFRLTVTNILKTSARRFFGSDSDIRTELLPAIQSAHKLKRQAEERARLLEQQRRHFRSGLTKNDPLSREIVGKLEALKGTIDGNPLIGVDRIAELLAEVADLRRQNAALRLGAAPKNLSSKQKILASEFQSRVAKNAKSSAELESVLTELLDRAQPREPKAVLDAERDQSIRHLRRRLSFWTSAIRDLLTTEGEKVDSFAKSRLQAAEQRLTHVVSDLVVGKISLVEALKLLAEETERIDEENEGQLAPVISLLETLAERIDLGLLAVDNSEQEELLRDEIGRLTSLAQLGITVEIVDHELVGYTNTVAHGLERLPEIARQTTAYRQIKSGFEGLTNRLKFLSPLRLSGELRFVKIAGEYIVRYLVEFFSKDLKAREFVLRASNSFRAFSIVEQEARILPVFVNLVNNARYWLQQSKNDHPEILLDVADNKVIVADNGPGVDESDIAELFRLFFSKRQGGRGVGLYLCRANLASGGHKIWYGVDTDHRILRGANFVIEFKNASF